jgi:hypothetical protein
MGDFNMPMAVAGDPFFDALTKLCLEVPDHSTQIASSIMSDAHYDQAAFFSGTTANCFTGKKGVFDYDALVFANLFGDGWQDGDGEVQVVLPVPYQRPSIDVGGVGDTLTSLRLHFPKCSCLFACRT